MPDFDFWCDMLEMAERLTADGEKDIAFKLVRILLCEYPPGDDPELQWVVRRSAEIFGLAAA